MNVMPTLKPSLVQVLVSTTLILILVLKKGLPYSILQHGIEWIQTQKENENIAKDIEKQKKKYAGHELTGKSLGVIGCGAIGIQVANLALRFGMKVYGYDPYMSVDAAWNLSRYVNHVTNIDDLYRQCDFITIHVPLNDGTKNFINKDSFDKMKDMPHTQLHLTLQLLLSLPLSVRLYNLLTSEVMHHRKLQESLPQESLHSLLRQLLLLLPELPVASA